MSTEVPHSEPPQETLVNLKFRVCKRLTAQGRWDEAQPLKDSLIREAREAGYGREDAQRRAYLAIDEMFPPLAEGLQGDRDRSEGGEAFRGDGDTERISSDSRTRDDESPVIGLGDLPESWPKLPANAPLAQEIQWVTANRLQVVTEIGDRSVVDLSKALTSAPSYAALGWLETSIRAYTKFVDVAAKATSQLEDEREHIRREKMAIADIRKLLAEMQTEG